ncbi:MAG: DUF721 domain-containing protein [Ignavibacteriales bacterium]|nr:DUF721 domain-containing protein [Ignavibacteriales bacterium]
MRRAGELLKTSAEFRRLARAAEEQRAIEVFPDVFPFLAKDATPLSVSGGTLHLRVENPAWRSEIKFREREILEKLNAELDGADIRRLKFAAR